jgi:hypothetical protein
MTCGDQVHGPADAEMTLVGYGSCPCPHYHAVHEVIERLRSRFGERMRYVFRHLPVDKENIHLVRDYPARGYFPPGSPPLSVIRLQMNADGSRDNVMLQIGLC